MANDVTILDRKESRTIEELYERTAKIILNINSEVIPSVANKIFLPIWTNHFLVSSLVNCINWWDV